MNRSANCRLFSQQDKPIELRKSCDYCVRLKRACDGKNPCSLCSRRHKDCTRSARKKSGPAKGTKYAPRRKRSPIAEWADAAVGERDLHPYDSPVGAIGGEVMRARSTGHLPLMTAMPPFLRSRVPGEIPAGSWGDPTELSDRRPRWTELDMPPISSSFPFPSDRLVKTEGLLGHNRRLSSRLDLPLDPPRSWSAPSMSLATRHQARQESLMLQSALPAPPDGSEEQGRGGKLRPVSVGGTIAPHLPLPLRGPSAAMDPRQQDERIQWEPSSAGAGASAYMEGRERAAAAGLQDAVVPMLPRSMGVDTSRGRLWEPPEGQRSDRQWDSFERTSQASMLHAKRSRLVSEICSTVHAQNRFDRWHFDSSFREVT